MGAFLDDLDKDIRVLMQAENMRKYEYPAGVGQIEGCPYESFSSLVNAVQKHEILVVEGHFPSDVMMSLLASPRERALWKIAVWGPWVVVAILLVLTFAMGNYWLAASILFPFVSGFLTSPGVGGKSWIPPTVSLAIGTVGLLAGSTAIFLLFGCYTLCHAFAVTMRRVFSRVILGRPLELESAFIFLLAGDYITCVDRDYVRTQWCKRFLERRYDATRVSGG